jgi:DNA polymerase-1
MSHADLPYEYRNVLNLAVNHRIQSTGASIVNRAAIRFYANAKACGIDAKLVLQVHDSLVVECPQEAAEEVLTLLQDAMENAVELPGVKFEAIPQIGQNLAKV